MTLNRIPPREKDEKPRDAKPLNAPDRVPDMPKNGDRLELDQEKKPRQEVTKPPAVPSGYKVRSVRQGKEVHSYYARSRPGASVRLLGRFQEQEGKKAEEARKSVKNRPSCDPSRPPARRTTRRSSKTWSISGSRR